MGRGELEEEEYGGGDGVGRAARDALSQLMDQVPPELAQPIRDAICRWLGGQLVGSQDSRVDGQYWLIPRFERPPPGLDN